MENNNDKNYFVLVVFTALNSKPAHNSKLVPTRSQS
jgi:hypothetical protein